MEERTATTYVLLVGDGTDGTGGQGWTEVGEIQAASREAAWAIAEEHYSETVVPQVEGDLIYAQLVPTRFFRKITVGIDRPEPRVQVQGL